MDKDFEFKDELYFSEKDNHNDDTSLSDFTLTGDVGTFEVTLTHEGNLNWLPLLESGTSDNILTSPNGTQFKLIVDDNGNLSTERYE